MTYHIYINGNHYSNELHRWNAAADLTEVGPYPYGYRRFRSQSPAWFSRAPGQAPKVNPGLYMIMRRSRLGFAGEPAVCQRGGRCKDVATIKR